MLEELLKEINKLKEYKKKYEYAIKDKQKMSDLLYTYMMEEWEHMDREDRVLAYKRSSCESCRYYDCCSISLPEDIWKPIRSDKAWIPSRVSCGKFKWS